MRRSALHCELVGRLFSVEAFPTKPMLGFKWLSYAMPSIMLCFMYFVLVSLRKTLNPQTVPYEQIDAWLVSSAVLMAV